MRSRSLSLAAGAAFMLAVACGEKPIRLEDLNTRVVTLPDGFKVRAEVMTDPQDMARGMMYRDSLPPGRGMLFLYAKPGKYSFWMYDVRIPLDIIWLDGNGTIVEISPNTPPCLARASECPSYGGKETALSVLELPAGSVEKHKLKIGARLSF